MPEIIEIEYSQTIGNVGYVLPMLEKLKVAEIIDKYCPKRCDGDYNHGEIINLMVCQTTQGRKPLYKLQDWFRDTLKVDDLLGYDSEKLTDDRLGDALSSVSQKIEPIYTEVVLNAVSQYGVGLSHIHNDLTSFQFYGVYESYDELIAQLKAAKTSFDTSKMEDPFSELVNYGYNRTGNQKLKVIIGNLSVTSDGQIPVSIQVHHGKTADTTTYAETYQKLQSQLTKASFLLIADSKLATPENLVTIACEYHGQFLSTGNLDAEAYETLSKLKEEDFIPLGYMSVKDQAKLRVKKERKRTKEQLTPTVYLGYEHERRINYCGKSVLVREIFIHSSTLQQQKHQTRQRHLQKASERLLDIQSKLNQRKYKYHEYTQEQIEKCLKKTQTTDFWNIRWISTDDGKLAFKFERDHQAIAESERFDGYFTLITNRPKILFSIEDALTSYKQQWGIEKKFAFTKGPLGVEPFYLKRNDRLVGMVLVMALAMLILSLTERQARDAQQQKQQDFSTFYSEGRVTGPLTLSKILDTTSQLGIAKLSHDGQSFLHITNQTLPYQQILDVLGLTEPPAKFFNRIRQRNRSRTFRQWHFSKQTEKNIAGEKPPQSKICKNSGM